MIDRYRGGRYAADHPHWHAEDAAHKAAAIAVLLRDLGWCPRSVLDVGCGTGDVLAALRPALPGAHLIGWDVTTPPRTAPGVERHVGDALTNAAPADLVLALDVAEHLPDPLAFLAGLARLAPRQILRLPLDLSVLDVLRPGRMLRARDIDGHLHAWTRDLALALVHEAGLRIVARRYDRVPPPEPTPRARVVQRVRRLCTRVAPDLAADLLGGTSLLIACESA